MSKQVNFNIKLNIDGRDVVVRATQDLAELRRAVKGVNDKADETRRALVRFSSISTIAQGVASGFQGVSTALQSLTAESRSFSAAMAEANTMAGKSGAQFEALKGQVAELAKTVPVARDALARGLYQVISNGVPEDNWLAFLEQSARSSVGGLADLGEVVKVTSTIVKNYGLSWQEAENIQDKIQLTAKYGVTSFEQLAAALPSVTGQAAQLGVSFSEMLAVFSTLTGVTGNTNEVATQLASVLTALTKESSKAQKAAADMGIFSRTIKKIVGHRLKIVGLKNEKVLYFFMIVLK